jgi:hypothetical protein
MKATAPWGGTPAAKSLPVRSILGGRNAMTVFCDYEHRVELEEAGRNTHTVQLPLPADANLTSEFGPYSKYWVLDVETVPASAQRASFLLPVYPAVTESDRALAPAPIIP